MAYGDPKIEVVVDKDGNATIEGKEFKDASCKQATAALQKALGQVAKQTLKPEGLREIVLGDKVKLGH
jgi:hypothetical protein